jgi:hypothetical protein
VVAVTLVNLLGGGASGSCSFAAPLPSLSPQLASIGGFDQPYDPSDTQTLESLATEAAAATSQNLIGASPGAPARLRALHQAQPDAIVIPLLYPSSSTHAGRVAGLVAFLQDCTDRAYFSSVEDLTSLSGAPPAFPSVSEQRAAAQLGTQQPQLSYGDSPFMPVWQDPATGDTIAAFS